MFHKEHKQFTSRPEKRGKNTDTSVPLNSSAQGRILGSTANKKGVSSKASLIKHDGIVMGGSITKARKSVSQESINKLPSGGKTRIIGEG